MENEAKNENRPVEEEAMEIDMSDFSEEDDDEEISGSEDTEQPETEEVSKPTETEEQEVDFTPLLNRLSQDIKYMDEEIKIESLDDVKTYYQKGLDYDRKVEKLKEIENSEELTYIREKAKESGLTPSEYIKSIKEYEVAQNKKAEENEINEMIENGIAENIARKVVETNRIAKELEQEKLQIKEQQRLAKEKEAKEAEQNAFLEAYPEVNVKDIPKEVFKDAEKTNLLTAYTKYKNQQLMKELEMLKQNKTNDETSPVKSTTEHGGAVVIKEDPFLIGLES